jgi:hypothetical protein
MLKNHNERSSLTPFGNVMKLCPNARIVLILPLEGGGAQVRAQSKERDCSMVVGRGIPRLEQDLLRAGIEVFKQEDMYYARAVSLYGPSTNPKGQASA